MLSRYEQFSFVISGIYRYIQKIERDEMVKYGYKGAFAQYLAVMNRHPEGVTASGLCEILEKDKAAVSRVISEMEQMGLIARRTEGNRQYKAHLTLTQEGKKAAEYVNSRAQAAVESVAGELSEEDRKMLYATLDMIAARLQKVSKNGIPE